LFFPGEVERWATHYSGNHFQLSEIAGAIDDAHDWYAAFGDSIERNPTFNHQGPRAISNLRPRPSKLWMTP
jgi:hypothetical protein